METLTSIKLFLLYRMSNVEEKMKILAEELRLKELEIEALQVRFVNKKVLYSCTILTLLECLT